MLLRFTRATLEGNWNLHIHSIREMLPRVFAMDQLCLVHVSLLVRHGVVAADPPLFQCVTWGQTLCSPGGIVGIGLNRGAVQRWILTAHDRANILQTCREMAGVIDVCIVDSFIVYNHLFFTSIQKRTGCSAWLCVPRTS